MENRILLKEIPTGKFHSVIFTTYCLNLYYLEQQVLPLLGIKGVHYISILADSHMLDAELTSHCSFSDQRKRSYSIHGIESKGTFHPKIIFLVGESNLLLLLGSGNLTSCGHGKNLEIWNSIFINSEDDKKLGIVIQAWNYLKILHKDLGNSAQAKLKSIEDNSFLLRNLDNFTSYRNFEIGNKTFASFLAATPRGTIFNQIVTIIGLEIIKEITVMCPYYDLEGAFLHLLNKQFKPKKINIVLQETFGTIPIKMTPSKNMCFYNWNEIIIGDFKQEYFHSKSIVFEGSKNKFLLTGSANASLSAFGKNKLDSTNQEANILYQSKNIDFVKLLCLDLNRSAPLKLSEFKQPPRTVNPNKSVKRNYIFIKNIENNYNNIRINLFSKRQFLDCKICLFNSAGKILFIKETHIKSGASIVQFELLQISSLLYCEIYNKSISISNKQYIIDISAFEGNNPSSKNRSLNQLRKLIEGGNFYTSKIIDYLNTIQRQKETKNITIVNSKSEQKGRNNRNIEENSDLLYLSYEKIQILIKQLEEKQKVRIYIEYNSVRLWESISLYLKESKEKELQFIIDEEETEDINKSTGRAEENKIKKSISKSNYDRLKDKVQKFLINYTKSLRSNINNQNAEQPSLIDLSIFLIFLEVLLHLVGHKEKVEGEQNGKNLLQIYFTTNDYSWSDFLLQIIGLFTLWCSQKGGFKQLENEDYKLKLELYKKMAFKISISAISIFSAINIHFPHNKISIWKKLCLLNANLSFNTKNVSYNNISDFDLFVPKETIIEIGEDIFTSELKQSLSFANHSSPKIDFYLHPNDGFTFIEKQIENKKNSLLFLKLLNTGYDWNDEIDNYWNAAVYSINDAKWFGVK